MDVDLGLLRIVAGESLQSAPPGALALGAPRRSARGRAHDLFFVNLGADQGRAGQLASLAADAFFGTPGSVTAALRQAAISVNQRLVDDSAQAPFIAGALRHRDLYLAQCGPGQVVLIRPSSVMRVAPEATSARPLGSSLAPMVQFRHFQVQPGDLLVTSNLPDEVWPDSTLAALAGLSLDHALDRLAGATTQDLRGLLLRVPGGSAAPAPRAAKAGEVAATAQTAGGPRSTQSRGDFAAAQPGAYDLPASIARSARPLREAWNKARSALGRAWAAFLNVLLRLAPGVIEPPRAGEFSPNILAFTAAAVPILVVGLSTLIYFRSGRAELFESYLTQAESAAANARLESDPQAARPEWVLASQWLDLAESYRQTDDSTALRDQVQAALDELDLVVRLDFTPTVSGGFGPQANLALLAATPTDLYAYDRANHSIWHAWSTGRGFEIDSQFDCLSGQEAVPGFGTPVSMVIQPEPGALGTEGVVAVDGDGTLLYCAPGVAPLTGQLEPPNLGWGELHAIAVFANDLYVLDPQSNAVWIYDATGGLFSGSPALYFVEDVPPLGTAIDLALAQDELMILYADGSIDRCRRIVENTTSGTLRIRVECESQPRFQDERPGQPALATIPAATPAQIVYSPPPEPSLFFMDSSRGTVYHYSMRLVYQAQYPTSFEQQVSAITVGPPNNLFVAAGDQVYVAQLGR